MNQNWKQTFRRMNLDADVRAMQPGEYRRISNGTPIQPQSSTNSIEHSVSNVIGNQLISYSLPAGTNKTIGFVYDKKSDRAFYAVWNSTPANCSIYQVKNFAVTLVMRTNLFVWASTDIIDMDIVGDILIFTNNRSDIQKINVVKAIAGGTYTPAATELTLIKPPPLSPVTWALGYDNTVDTNRMYGNYFQFFERYIYEDYDYSVFGPSSTVTNSWLHPSGTDVKSSSSTNVAALTGTGAFDGVLLVAGDRILLLGQNTASQNGVWVIQAGAWTRPVDFATGSNSDITVYIRGGTPSGATSLNWGQVWRVISTNVDTAATNLILLQGPNYLTITRTASIPATVIGIEYAVRINGSNEFIIYREEKVGSFSSTHTFYNDTYLFTVPDSDTFVWNDNIPLTSKALKIFKNRIFLFNNTEGYNHVTTTAVTLTLTAVNSFVGVTSSPSKTIKVAKTGGKYRVGVIWFDAGGRHSGVHCDALINIPSVGNGGTGFNKIHVDLSSIAADIPAWAVRTSVVMTKELTSSFFVGSKTQDIFYFKKDGSGAYSYSKTLSGFAAEGTAIDITSLTKDRLGYTFQQEDHIILKGVTSGNVDVEILGQDGRFILTRVISELDPTNTMITSQSSNVDFQIYTPKINGEEPFYETGLTATGDIEGDVEVITDTYGWNNGVGYSQTAPFTNDYPLTGHGWIESMAVWNKNYPLWVTQSGRPMVKTDSRQINKYTYLRFGQEYILNANFLGLNTFYALDEQALPIENGAGMKLAEAGEVLVAIHEIEAEAIYVGQGFIQTKAGDSPSGNLFLTKTESVIGDARKYLGGHGSLHPTSVVARDGNVYYLDMRKGVVVRRAQDGLTVISDDGVRGFIGNLCAFHASLATSRIVAGWDPQYDCYCLSFQETDEPTHGLTLYYKEKDGWVFDTQFKPELFGIINQYQLGFTSGQAWVQTLESNYNKFFGTQYNRQVVIEFSPLRSLEHVWDAVEVDVPLIYVTDGSNEDVLYLSTTPGSPETQINYKDFVLRGSAWRSAFFRWLNDANFGSQTESKYKSAKRIRGQNAYVTLMYNGTDRNPMKSITIFYTPSMLSTP